jgi:ADP-ribose pyrophosphatase
VSRRVIAEGKYIRLVDVDGWEFVERCNASGVVAIIAITADHKIVLTEQKRRAVGKMVIDLPAGLAGDTPGDESEALAIAARRELIEEVGYDVSSMRELETTPPSPGLTSELVTFFAAEGIKRSARAAAWKVRASRCTRCRFTISINSLTLKRRPAP